MHRHRNLPLVALLALVLISCGDDGRTEISLPDAHSMPAAACDAAAPAGGGLPFVGPLPILPDLDWDGISDDQERRDGTDPGDPADARAWHPEWSGHPRLLFGTEDLDWIRARCLTGPPPYPELYALVRSIAGWTPLPHDRPGYDPRVEDTRGLIAKCAAFVAVIEEDGALARKAIDLLLSIRTDVHTVPLAEADQGTIHTSQALTTYAQAFDWLVGFGYLDGEDYYSARWLIRELARATHRFYLHDFPFVLAFARNNHAIKFASGIGMVGMLLNDEPEAARYVNFAMTEVEGTLLDFQNPPGGGQAEGPGYLVYSMLTYFSFLAAYTRFAQGETYPYRQFCQAHFFGPCVEGVRPVEDLWTSERLTAVHQWWLDLRMPGGGGPNIDDSRLHCAHTGLLAAQMGSAEANREFLASRDCHLGRADSLLVETIVLHDPDLPAHDPPGSPMRFLSGAGNAVLRSGWDADARYLLLLGERGVARTSGLAHEQVDATSFLVAAYGEYLLIDSGYITYEDRWKVNAARNHNLILVDGDGAGAGWQGMFVDVDAWLSQPIDDGVLQAATATARYRGVTFRRSALLVDGRYFATLDRTEAGAPHLYTFLLHTNAGGRTDGEFERTDEGCTVGRPLARLTAVVAATPGPGSLRDHVDFHGFTEAESDHAVLALDVEGLAPSFLGVYLPAPAGEELPAARVIRPGPGAVAVRVDLPDSIDLLLATEGDEERVFPAALTGLPEVAADAPGGLVRFDPGTQEPTYQRAFGPGRVRVMPR